MNREKLIGILSKYFSIGDSDTYVLTRVKEGFAVGTVTIDDFQELDEENVADLADYILKNTDNEVTLKLDLGDRTPEEIKQIAEMFNGEIKKQVAKEILQPLHYEIEREKGAGIIYGDFNYGLDTALNKVESLAEKYGVEIDE